MIPLVRETVLPGFIRTFGCSAAKLEVYVKNTTGKHLFVRGDEIFSEKFGWTEVKRDLIKAGVPRGATPVQEPLLAAASQGEGSQLKNTSDAWSQDTNFALADAVYEGDVRKLCVLRTCGFDVTEKYTHPEVNGGSPETLKDIATAKHRDRKGKEINTMLERIEGGGRLVTRDKEILPFIRTLDCVEIEAALIEAGMPRDAKSVQEALLAASMQGEGNQLKKTFDAWRQDTNFVLADAVYEGDVGKRS